MRLFGTSVAVFSFLLAGWLVANEPEPRQSLDQSLHNVRSAVSAMDGWLGRGRNANRWREFLRVEQLRQQLEQGDEAEPSIVEAQLAAYASETPGLNAARFVAVRDALAVWLQELKPPAPNELPQLVLDAKQRYTPISADNISAARGRLSSRVQVLDRFLGRGRRAQRDAWKRFLQWELLEAELAKGNMPDLPRLEMVLKRLDEDQPGLELPVFTDVRDALRRFGNTVYYARPETEQAFQTRMDALAKQLQQLTEDPDNETAISVGQSLGWLENARQASGVVRGIRRNFFRPNLHLQISSHLISAAADEDVSEQNRVYENIMGVSITARTNTQGKLSARLVPDRQRATMEILLQGATSSTNVGRRGPVTIYSRGHTDVTGRKQIWLDEAGIHDLPASASCRTKTNVTGIGARHELLRRVAWNQVAQKRGQAEVIASRRAERRVRREMNERADKMLGEANEEYRTKFRNPLLRRNGFPQLIYSSSDQDALSLNVRQAGFAQLGAPDSPPEIQAGHDMAVRLHESWASNFSEAALANYTLTDKKLAELSTELTGKIPDDLQVDEDNPWSITFASAAPIRMTFKDDKLQVSIRGRQFTRGDEVISKSMEISATYALEQDARETKLIRQGDVVVEYFRLKGTQSVQQVAFKSFLKKKFEAMFKPEFISEGLALPGRLEKIGKLKLQEFASRNGWLTLGWRLQAPERAAQTR